MPARERLSPVEQYLAYLIGLGIALAIIAALLMGFGGASANSTRAMLWVGIALAVIGIAAWLYFVRPWRHFDDLKTPYYTGHEEHEVEEPAPALEAAPMAGGPELAETLEAALDAALAAEPGTALETQLDAALETEREVEPAALPAAERAPAALGEAEPGAAAPVERDDLLIIEGLGPKSQQVLYAAGITTYRAVAEASPETLAGLIRNAGLRLVHCETWPDQARLLAAGDMAGFQALRQSLRDRRRP